MKDKSMNKKNILISYLILSCFNLCICMEERKPEEQIEKDWSITRLLELKKTNRLGSVDRFEAEWDNFANNQKISNDRKNQKEQNPHLEKISKFREQMAEIDLKITRINRLECLLDLDQPNKTKNKKKTTKKPTFRSVSRQMKKVKNHSNIEQKLKAIKLLLDKENSKNLSLNKREKLCNLLDQISELELIEYSELLDKKIEDLSKKIKDYDLNLIKLQKIRKSSFNGPLTPRSLPNENNTQPRKISRANTIDSLPIKKKNNEI